MYNRETHKVVFQDKNSTILESVRHNYIVKCIPHRRFRENEIYFLKQVTNRTDTVNYITHFKDDLNTYIIMTRVPDVIDLFDFINQKKKRIEQEAIFILHQLITTLLWYKSRSILHSDIKDENILIHPKTLAITVIDFGSSQIWRNETYTTYPGTDIYCCPEYITKGEYTADGLTSFQIGNLFFNLLFGDIPFQTPEEIVNKELCIDHSVSLSKEAVDFLFQCLNKNPQSRLKLENMNEHPLFNIT